MREETRKDIDTILYTFGAEDGAVSYVKFRAMLENVDAQAEKGEPASVEILKIMRQFARLVKLTQT